MQSGSGEALEDCVPRAVGAGALVADGDRAASGEGVRVGSRLALPGQWGYVVCWREWVCPEEDAVLAVAAAYIPESELVAGFPDREVRLQGGGEEFFRCS